MTRYYEGIPRPNDPSDQPGSPEWHRKTDDALLFGAALGHGGAGPAAFALWVAGDRDRDTESRPSMLTRLRRRSAGRKRRERGAAQPTPAPSTVDIHQAVTAAE